MINIEKSGKVLIGGQRHLGPIPRTIPAETLGAPKANYRVMKSSMLRPEYCILLVILPCANSLTSGRIIKLTGLQFPLLGNKDDNTNS